MTAVPPTTGPGSTLASRETGASSAITTDPAATDHASHVLAEISRWIRAYGPKVAAAGAGEGAHLGGSGDTD